MISLEGLTLCTGRIAEARGILLTFAHHLRDGLIPNLFPEGDQEGSVQHGRRHALVLSRASIATSPSRTMSRRFAICCLRSKRSSGLHLAGTRFGIRVDEDGLLTQGAANLALTWMDAKVGDWVVTPRRGKTVEINALWYNAVRLLADWYRFFERDASELDAVAERARASFNRRFWFDEGQYLYDIVDGEAGDDSSLRPNQIFALALRHPVLDEARWQRIVDVVAERLLTPFGLRTLEPGHKDFKAQYFGDLRARDAAYHQGTVWAWLIGPFIDAWLRAYPGRRTRGAVVPRGVRQPSERCVHRDDQRGLRCQRTLRAARLHRAGLERRRGVALVRDSRRCDQRSRVSPRRETARTSAAAPAAPSSVRTASSSPCGRRRSARSPSSSTEGRRPDDAGAGRLFHGDGCPTCAQGERYWFRLAQGLRPDPVSRFQPDGPFGPSMVVDPHAFTWSVARLGGARAATSTGRLRAPHRHVHDRRHLGLGA